MSFAENIQSKSYLVDHPIQFALGFFPSPLYSHSLSNSSALTYEFRQYIIDFFFKLTSCRILYHDHDGYNNKIYVVVLYTTAGKTSKSRANSGLPVMRFVNFWSLDQLGIEYHDCMVNHFVGMASNERRQQGEVIGTTCRKPQM